MKLISYAGVVFTSEGIDKAYIVRGLPGENRTPDLRQRLGSSAEIIGATGSGRTIPCHLRITSKPDERVAEAKLRRILGLLDVQSNEARPLVCQIDVDANNDGVIEGQQQVTVNAVIGSFSWMDRDRAIEITFHTEDSRWFEASVTTETDVVTPATITNPTFASDATGWTKGSDPTDVTSAFKIGRAHV